MLIITVLVTLLASVLSLNPPGCGFLNRTLVSNANAGKTSRLIGGTVVEQLQVPWLLRLDAGEDRGICTASLISKDRLLTAAHCFVSKDEQAKTCVEDRRTFTACQSTVNNHLPCPNPIGIKKIFHLTNYMLNGCIAQYDYVVVQLNTSLNTDPVCLPTPSNGINDNYDYSKHTAYLLGFSGNYDGYPDKRTNTALRMIKIGKPKDAGDRGTFIIMKTVPGKKSGHICGGDCGGPMIQLQGDRAVIVAVNVRAPWSCVGHTVIPEAGKPQVQFHVTIKPRFNDDHLALDKEETPIKVFNNISLS